MNMRGCNRRSSKTREKCKCKRRACEFELRKEWEFEAENDRRHPIELGPQIACDVAFERQTQMPCGYQAPDPKNYLGNHPFYALGLRVR